MLKDEAGPGTLSLFNPRLYW